MTDQETSATTQDTTWKVGFTAREEMTAFIVIRAKSADEAAKATVEYIQKVTPELEKVEITTVEDMTPQSPIKITYKEVPPNGRIN